MTNLNPTTLLNVSTHHHKSELESILNRLSTALKAHQLLQCNHAKSSLAYLSVAEITHLARLKASCARHLAYVLLADPTADYLLYKSLARFLYQLVPLDFVFAQCSEFRALSKILIEMRKSRQPFHQITSCKPWLTPHSALSFWVKEWWDSITNQSPCAPTSQYTGAEHQVIRDLFASLKQSAREAHSLHHQVNQDDVQAHAKGNPSRVLEVPAVTEVDKAVLAYLEAFFASDRSSSEILKLSHRLFNLGQAYNKTGK